MVTELDMHMLPLDICETGILLQYNLHILTTEIPFYYSSRLIEFYGLILAQTDFNR